MINYTRKKFQTIVNLGSEDRVLHRRFGSIGTRVYGRCIELGPERQEPHNYEDGPAKATTRLGTRRLAQKFRLWNDSGLTGGAIFLSSRQPRDENAE